MKTLIRQCSVVGVCLLSALLLACRSTSPEPEQQPIRIGYFPTVLHAAALVAIEQGMFTASLPPTATLELRTFNAGPAAIEALFAGELDLAYVGPSPALNGFQRSKGRALRVIAGAASGGAQFIVRPEADVRTPADLLERRLATPQLGNTQDVALRHYLRQHGLNPNPFTGNVSIFPAQSGELFWMFRRGEVDGAWVPEPLASRLVIEAGGVVFVDERDLWHGGRFATALLIARADLLRQRPDFVRAVLRAHLDAVTFIQRYPQQAKALVNQGIQRAAGKPLRAEVLDRAFSMFEPTYDPLADTIAAQAERAAELGLLRLSPEELSGLYDVHLLNALLVERGYPPVSIAP
ncbi:MAG: ABC transporter substrate-binding protein [Thermoflexales bacterium]|nr:ABC transporter substrate-binding protein [Thermoflexales bacterium]